MKRFSKVLVFVLALALSLGACFSLTACGGGENELRVFTMFGPGDDHNKAYQENVDKFLKANEGVSIEDMSLPGATNTYDTILESKFASDSSAPDVLYTFAPGRNSGFASKLIPIADAAKKHPELTAGINMAVAPDKYSIPMKGITEGIQYDAARYSSGDFASYTTFMAAVARENKADEELVKVGDKVTKSGSKVTNPIGEINYWANYILLEKLGDTLADAGAINKEWLTTNSTAFAAGIQEIKDQFVNIGWDGTSSAPAYGNEKGAMWKGQRSLTIDGSWNVGGFYAADSGWGEAGGIAIHDDDTTKGFKLRNIVIGNSSTKYVLAGYTHGWMITKKCYENPEKLALAVKFIKSQMDNVQTYADKTGGFYSKPVTYTSEYKMAKDFRELTNISGAKLVIPIDDKFSTIAAKNAFFENLVKLLNPDATLTATGVVDAVIRTFNN